MKTHNHMFHVGLYKEANINNCNFQVGSSWIFAKVLSLGPYLHVKVLPQVLYEK